MNDQKSWLIIQQGRKTCLFGYDDEAFYLININRNLIYETEELLEERGISEKLLKELQLSFDTYPRTQINGVGIGGCCAGDSVFLYMKGRKRIRFILADDYPEEMIEFFFEGLPRFLPPQSKKHKEKEQSWRRKNRDPELYNKLFFVPPLLCALGAFFNIGYAFQGGYLWYSGCLLSLLIPLVLDIAMPAYFTLIPPEKGKDSDAKELFLPLWIHFFFLVLQPGHNWLNEDLFFVIWGVVGGGLVILFGLFAEEFKRKKTALLAVFLAGFIGTLVIGNINEVFDFSEPEGYVVTVEDLQSTRSRRSSTYECTVTLPDGRQVDLEIDRGFYRSLEIGDSVLVEHGTGALGIEYANVYPMN